MWSIAVIGEALVSEAVSSCDARRLRQGLTRMNLLVCVSLSCVLFAIVLPALQVARESSRRAVCYNNLAAIAKGLHSYHDASRAFPYGCVGNPDQPPSKRWSWYLCIGNYMEHYGSPIIDLQKSWDAQELRPLMLRTWRNGPYYEYDVPLRPFLALRCPSAPDKAHSDGQPFATYVGMGGVGADAPMLPSGDRRAGVWAYERQTRLADLLDGGARTILLIETARDTGCWLAGGEATVRGADIGTDSAIPYVRGVGDVAQFGGLHPGGGLAVFVDGHVGFVSGSTEPAVFKSLCTGWGHDVATIIKR
jgi:hypothetical protein